MYNYILRNYNYIKNDSAKWNYWTAVQLSPINVDFLRYKNGVIINGESGRMRIWVSARVAAQERACVRHVKIQRIIKTESLSHARARTHTHTHAPVSYTHLDVYKRQELHNQNLTKWKLL